MSQVRRGATLLIALFILSMTCMFMADQARVLLLRMKLQKIQLRDSQELLLQQAAHERAELQFKLNSEYNGETWQPDFENQDNTIFWKIVIQKEESSSMTTPAWEINVSQHEVETH
jgi:hypothetical protein